MKSDFTSRLKHGASALAIAATLPFAIQASYAADDAAAADEDITFEEVVVTGSRIKRKDLESSSPLFITTAQEIKKTGYVRIEDMMNSLPQVEAASNAFISNGATGGASLDLRGLGAIRTLVLINGRRMQPGGISQLAPDVNQIPAGLIKQVEVLTGGASSVYGADAVAGVVNFVMDKEFEGVQLTTGVAAYQHNNNNQFVQGLLKNRNFDFPTGSSGLDGEQYNVELILGGSFADGKGHATVYGSYRKVEEVRQGARDFSSCALSSSATSCGGSATTAVLPNFYVSRVTADGGYDFNEPFGGPLRNLTENGGVVEDDGTNRYNFAPINHFQRPDERWSGGAFINYEINDSFKPYFEFSFMTDRTRAQIAESGTFFVEPYAINCDNPLLPAAFVNDTCGVLGLGANDQISVYVGKRNIEGGPRTSILGHNAFRMVTGMEGDINDNWSYDVSFFYGQTTSEQVYVNDFFAPKIGLALDAVLDGDGNIVCRSGGDCIPYNVFTPGGVTTAAAGALTGTGIQTGISKEYVANGFVSGTLPIAIANDPISVVFGFEHRKEVYRNISDEIFEKGQLLGQGGATPSIGGSYNVTEVFGEAYVPLIQDVDMIQDLSLELAYRFSSYNTSGGASTYKVGLNWQAIDEVKFRASYNRAVRAPNVSELFSSQSIGLWSGNDPCSGANPTLTQAQCLNTGLTAAQYGNTNASPASQYNGFFGGNPDLKPEIADTFTIGVVANPLDGFQFSLDYWDIKITDVIGIINPELAVTQCGLTGDASFCNLVNRAPNGSLWLGQAGFVTGTNVNLAGRRWKGVDVAANYQIDEVFGGTFDVSLVGSRLIKKTTDPLPGVPDAAFDCTGLVTTKCFPSPKWRHTMSVAYGSGSFWSATVKWRYFASVNNPDSDDGSLNDGIGAQSYIDLSLTFDVTENVSLLMGVNNIFDKAPPLVGGSLGTNGNTYAGYYDTLGRLLHASVSTKF